MDVLRYTVVLTLGLLILMGVLLMGCSPSEEQSLSLQSVDVPVDETSFAPRLSVDDENRLLLSYLAETEDGHALKMTRYDGSDWDAVQTVAEGDNWFANWADTPGVRPVGDWLFAHWLVRSGPVAYHYDIHAAWSADDGATWSDSFVLHDDGVQAEHGFVSSVVLDDGALGIAWLDGRHTASNDAAQASDHSHGSHPQEHGAMSLRWARLEPGDSRPTRDLELDTLVCDCCMTASVRDSKGLRVFYRDRSTREVRDIASARVTPSDYYTAGRVAEDDWQIAACPVEGPAAAQRGSTTDVVWFTGSHNTSEVFWAYADDGTDTFSGAQRVDMGNPAGRVGAVSIDANRTLISWIESGDSSGHIVARIVSEEGMSAASPLVPVSTSRGSGFPVLAHTMDTAWMAWTDATSDTRRIRIGRIDGI